MIVFFLGIHTACAAFGVFIKPTTNLIGVDRDGSSRKQEISTFLATSRSNSERSTNADDLRTLALITFDLDDTLFPINPVIEDANQAMVRAMHRLGFEKASTSSFLQHAREIRKSLELTSPISYTELRKRAIERELTMVAFSHAELRKRAIECELTMVATNDAAGSDMKVVNDAMIEECYAAWLNERHAAAERYLFPDAVGALSEIQRLFPDACIGAITNGAGDPRAIPSLEPFFHFRVSGEDREVFPFRKPSARIFEVALDRFSGKIDHNLKLWFHVGDCLANDVRASALCGAKAVWFAGHLTSKDTNDSTKRPVWSTTTEQELNRRQKQAEEGKTLLAAQISNLAQLPRVIATIIETA